MFISLKFILSNFQGWIARFIKRNNIQLVTLPNAPPASSPIGISRQPLGLAESSLQPKSSQSSKCDCTKEHFKISHSSFMDGKSSSCDFYLKLGPALSFSAKISPISGKNVQSPFHCTEDCIAQNRNVDPQSSFPNNSSDSQNSVESKCKVLEQCQPSASKSRRKNFIPRKLVFDTSTLANPCDDLTDVDIYTGINDSLMIMP